MQCRLWPGTTNIFGKANDGAINVICGVRGCTGAETQKPSHLVDTEGLVLEGEII